MTARRWVRAILVLAAAAAFALAAGCGGSSGDDDDSGDGGGGGGGGAPTATRTPRVTVTNATVTFEASATSPATGTATLVQDGGNVQITVTMTGLPEGAHALYVNRGACDDPGRVGPLTPLEAAADGSASSESSMLAQLTDFVGGHVLIYEGETASTDAVVLLCGEIVAATP
jgi:hypothetical protein